MGRAKHQAGKPPAAPVAQPEAQAQPAAVLVAPASRTHQPAIVPVSRSVESVIRDRLSAPERPAPVMAPTIEPSAASVRASFRAFNSRVMDVRIGEGYTAPEERANPEELKRAQDLRKAQETENLRKSRASFGIDNNVKVVFPSPSRSGQAVAHKW